MSRHAITAEVAGVRITHPDRVMYPTLGATKLDLARYYEAIAPWLVPHTEGRPLTLVRCPTGLDDGCFYMRHSNVWAPEALRRVSIPEKTKIGTYLVADSAAAVVSLVQMNVVEIHTWNSRVGDLERPDRLVFDIDPGPEVSWRHVVEAARVVRETLNALGLRSFVKTTGGRGVHVVAPLIPAADWNLCLAFARGVAETMARHDSTRFTTRFAKRGRERRILIDYLRNNRTNTSIAAYSMRARAGAPVSVPLEWNELTARRGPERFTILTVPRRLATLRVDPWQEYWRTRQRVTRAMLTAVGGADDEMEGVDTWRTGE